MASFCRHFLLLILFLPRFFPPFILARHLLSRDTNQLIPANELRKISSYSGFIAVPSHNLVSPYIHITWRVLYFTLILFALSISGDVIRIRVRVQNSLNYSTGNCVRTIFCEIMFVDLIFFGHIVENVFIILHINCTLIG